MVLPSHKIQLLKFVFVNICKLPNLTVLVHKITTQIFFYNLYKVFKVNYKDN